MTTIGKQARLAEPVRDLPREKTTIRGGRDGGRSRVFALVLPVGTAVFAAGAPSCCCRSSSCRRSGRSSGGGGSSGGEGGAFALVEIPLLLVGRGFDEEQAEEAEGEEGVDTGEGLPGPADPGGVRGHDEEEEQDVLEEGREGGWEGGRKGLEQVRGWWVRPTQAEWAGMTRRKRRTFWREGSEGEVEDGVRRCEKEIRRKRTMQFRQVRGRPQVTKRPYLK